MAKRNLHQEEQKQPYTENRFEVLQEDSEGKEIEMTHEKKQTISQTMEQMDKHPKHP